MSLYLRTWPSEGLLSSSLSFSNLRMARRALFFGLQVLSRPGPSKPCSRAVRALWVRAVKSMSLIGSSRGCTSSAPSPTKPSKNLGLSRTMAAGGLWERYIGQRQLHGSIKTHMSWKRGCQAFSVFFIKRIHAYTEKGR